ncbi:hypothetical protein D3C78_847630 [compost metagenome]
MVVVDELAVLDLFTGLPHQQGADRVLAHDGVEQPTDLLLAPHEGPLDIWQPESPALRLGIVEVGDNLADRQFPVLHRLRP